MKEWTDKERLKAIDNMAIDLIESMQNGIPNLQTVHNIAENIHNLSFQSKEFLNANLKRFKHDGK